MHLQLKDEKEVSELNNLLLNEIYRLENMMKSTKQQLKIRESLNLYDDNNKHYLVLKSQLEEIEPTIELYCRWSNELDYFLEEREEF